MVARRSRSTKLLYTPGPVSTGMGDRLRAGKPPQFVTSHSGQLSLLPSDGRKISTGHSAVTPCGWGVKAKAATVHSTCECMCGWQVNLCDPSLTRAIPERFTDEFHMIKRYTNLLLLYVTDSKVDDWLLAGIADNFHSRYSTLSGEGISLPTPIRPLDLLSNPVLELATLRRLIIL